MGNVVSPSNDVTSKEPWEPALLSLRMSRPAYSAIFLRQWGFKRSLCSWAGLGLCFVSLRVGARAKRNPRASGNPGGPDRCLPIAVFPVSSGCFQEQQKVHKSLVEAGGEFLPQEPGEAP
uniref:uncharacterized protein LOC103791196 isoform X3 n=1 Tax=Callithrix jacchus TaxID=9483 RepID=UPI0023DD5B14|nr:uncharacterized protein LOC103791196 isoform X3 [Callithrix jacchus]